MSVSTIAARVVFNTGGAVVETVRFMRSIQMSQRHVMQLKKASDKTGVSVKEFISVMRQQNHITQTQRNIRLATTVLGSFTRAASEARKMYQAFVKDTSRPPPRRGGGAGATASSLLSQASGMAVGAAGGKRSGDLGFGGTLMAALSSDALLSGAQEVGDTGKGVGGLLSKWIQLAAVMEGAQTTFDAMLGSQQESEKLLARITTYAQKTPFGRMDVIEASKRLLTISGKDLDKNERLFRMAGNIAALRPGSKVTDVSQGIVQATVGEFEILKSSFGLMLRADMFKDHGQAGGKEYTEAVLKEIERQFKEKTGGADLVAALGDTMIGKASTLTDTIEIIGQMVGTKLVEVFGIKETMSGAITVLDQLGSAMQHFLDPSKDSEGKLLEGVDGRIINAARRIVDALDFIGKAYDEWMPRIKEGATQLGIFLLDWHEWFLGAAAAGSAFGTVVSAVMVPAVALAVALFGLAGTAVTVFGAMSAVAAYFSIPLLGAALGSLAMLMVPVIILGGVVVLALASMAAGFMAFKDDSETSFEALIRLVKVGRNLFLTFWGIVSALGSGFMATFGPDLAYSFNIVTTEMERIAMAIGGMVRPWLMIFGREGVDNMGAFVSVGKAIGWVLGKVIVLGAKAVSGWLWAIANLFEFLSGAVVANVSDIYLMHQAFKDFLTGVGDSRLQLRTIMLGILDIITMPFRNFIGIIVQSVEEGLRTIEAKIRPWNTGVADKLAEVIVVMDEAGEKLEEGFLRTGQMFKQGMNVSLSGVLTAHQPVEVKIDGQKVGEAVTKTDIRARNSGRGGDPVTPEELGFVLEGSNRIRTVGLNEVAKDF